MRALLCGVFFRVRRGGARALGWFPASPRSLKSSKDDVRCGFREVEVAHEVSLFFSFMGLCWLAEQQRDYTATIIVTTYSWGSTYVRLISPVLSADLPSPVLQKRKKNRNLCTTHLLQDKLSLFSCTAGRFAFAVRAGWRRAKTKEGETLYVNDTEKITSWDPPVAIAPPATVLPHGSEGCHENRKNHGAAVVLGRK